MEVGHICGSLDWWSHFCPCQNFIYCLSRRPTPQALSKLGSPHDHVCLSAPLQKVNASAGHTYPHTFLLWVTAWTYGWSCWSS